ncbi:hypothetical protein TB1_018097 [Malus domestica]
MSSIQQRDLAWGVRSDHTGYERGLEVYHPNFCSRQLNFRQAILVPFFYSMHYETSYHLCFPLEVMFRAARCNLEVMSKIALKPVVLNFECTPSFATWWKAKWSKKFGMDIRDAHDCFFEQLFFKFYLKNDELEN